MRGTYKSGGVGGGVLSGGERLPRPASDGPSVTITLYCHGASRLPVTCPTYCHTSLSVSGEARPNVQPGKGVFPPLTQECVPAVIGSEKILMCHVNLISM